MMSYTTSLFFIIIFSISTVHGEDCTHGTSSNFVNKFLQSCPEFMGDQTKTFCCPQTDNSFFCCDAQEYALLTGLKLIIPAIIVVLAVVCLFVFCISCLCCSCCPWYRRRHRGTVYGTAHTLGGTHQTSGINPPSTHIVNTIPQYQVNQPAPPTAYPSQPPPYTAEPYAKQAPYNPNYPQ